MREVLGLYAVTMPYAERIYQLKRKSIAEVTTLLDGAACKLSEKIGGKVKGYICNPPLEWPPFFRKIKRLNKAARR
jgi:hypothetical protein